MYNPPIRSTAIPTFFAYSLILCFILVEFIFNKTNNFLHFLSICYFKISFTPLLLPEDIQCGPKSLTWSLGFIFRLFFWEIVSGKRIFLKEKISEFSLVLFQ